MISTAPALRAHFSHIWNTCTFFSSPFVCIFPPINRYSSSHWCIALPLLLEGSSRPQALLFGLWNFSSYKCQKAARNNLVSLLLKVRLKFSELLFAVGPPLEERNHIAHFRNSSWSTGCPTLCFFPNAAVLHALERTVGLTSRAKQAQIRKQLIILGHYAKAVFSIRST